ncbi:MAG: hypothetical protein AMJ69_07590 [Gammaproteobacteria bacterium SG8_47]|nr:MAG: hypothetical protein AMJ69_07590 [Gammaproteobacteria bacterium SG8_47]
MNIIDRCQNLRGQLSREQRGVLQRMLRAPDEAAWAQSRRFIITVAPLQTLDMAIEAVAPQWMGAIPDPFTVYRAMRFAVERQEDYLVEFIDRDSDGY